MKVYKKTLAIPSFDSDKDGRIKAESIIKYLSEMSVQHNNLTIGDKKLKENSYGWMIRNWKIEIEELPRVNDEITLETWVSRVDKFFVNREFNIYKGSRPIIKGTALWIFMDMERKRPIRLTDEFIEKNDIVEKHNFKTFHRYLKDTEYDDFLEFKTRRSDIDSNEHVNNMIYFSWMLENIPKEIYETKILKEIEIEYRNEVLHPSKIMSGIKVEQGSKGIIVKHGICEKGTNKLNAQGLTKWE